MSTATLDVPVVPIAHDEPAPASLKVTRHFRRTHVAAPLASIPKIGPTITTPKNDFARIARQMYFLMMRNVATDGFVFSDPIRPGTYSLPGCVIAAPSFPADTPGVDQDYVYNWTRDAAITSMEIVAAHAAEGGPVQELINYVNFAQICQNNARPTLAHASFTVRGEFREWSDQNDGPALQSVAIMQAYSLLDTATQATAKAVINRNIDFLMNVYKDPTTNLWEEHVAYSLFARSAQLRCFRAAKANNIGIPVPAGIDEAIAWLENAIASHWDGKYYISMMNPTPAGYDPNIDTICASIYGAIPCTDTKLLATAALLRSQWADDTSPYQYPINKAEKAQGLGPLLGRYPEDTYDGDMSDHNEGRHPWALCTCNLAELYYNVARTISKSGIVPMDAFSAEFFDQLGVGPGTQPAEAAQKLESAADAMLNAVIYHSDHLELSEQFDGVTGYEKSVKNLTWSYAAFLSAVRAKTGVAVEG